VNIKVFLVIILIASFCFAADTVTTSVDVNALPEGPGGGSSFPFSWESYHKEVVEKVEAEEIMLEEDEFFCLFYPNYDYTFNFKFDFEEEPELEFSGPLKEYVIEDTIQITKETLNFKIKIPDTIEDVNHLNVDLSTETQYTSPSKIYVKQFYSPNIFLDYRMSHNKEDTKVDFKITNLNHNEKLKLKLTLPKYAQKWKFHFNTMPDEFYFGSTVLIWNLDLKQNYVEDLSFEINEPRYDVFLGANVEYEFEEDLKPFFVIPEFYLFLCTGLMSFFLMGIFVIKNSDDYQLKELEYLEQKTRQKLKEVKRSRHN